MSMTSTIIMGLGHYLPSKVVTNEDLSQMFDTSDEWIRQRSGIRERRFVERAGIGPADLAVPAVQDACASAGIELSELDAIIFATLSPDHYFPGSGVLLGDKLGLQGLPALDVRNQCSGFLYGMKIADAWIRCGMYERIALVGAEVHSNILNFSNEGRDMAVLFGDGAACAVLGPTKEEARGIIDVELHADGSGAPLLWQEFPSSRETPMMSAETVSGLRHFPSMEGRRVFKMATRRMPEVGASVLERAGLRIEDVDLLIPHQANARISEAVAERLGVPADKVFQNIDKYGNTSAASIPIALSEAVAQDRISAGDLLLMTAFGSGFTWGAGLLRL